VVVRACLHRRRTPRAICSADSLRHWPDEVSYGDRHPHAYEKATNNTIFQRRQLQWL